MKISTLDIETTGLNPRKDKILAIAVKTNDDTSYVLDTAVDSHLKIKSILTILATDYDVVIAHNAKFDGSFIKKEYDVSFYNWYCTMLGSQIIQHGDEFTHSLLNCLNIYLGVSETDTNHKSVMREKFMNHTYGTPITDDMKEYVLSDVKYLEPLRDHQVKKALQSGDSRVLRLDNRLLSTMIDMELGGCRVDAELWGSKIDGWKAKRGDYVVKMDKAIVKLAETIPSIRGGIYTRKRKTANYTQGGLFSSDDSVTIVNKNVGNINYGSSTQVKELFRRVDKQQLESVDTNHLQVYLTENPDSKLKQFTKSLLKYREHGKLVTTYGQKFLDKLDENGYIHTNYSQCRTKTLRLSSSNPNLQNIPQGELRECFLPDPGDVMITCDMDRAEVTIAADYSGDPLLNAGIQDGIDIHSKLASVSYSIIFNRKFTVSKDESYVQVRGLKVKPNQLRNRHKNAVFCKFYKGGVKTIYGILAEYINKLYTGDQRMVIATQVSKALDIELGGLSKYLDKVIKKGQKDGYLTGVIGWRRNFGPDDYGSIANFDFQHSNAVAMKIALIRIDDYLRDSGVGRLVLNVHDEVVCSVKKEDSEQAKERIEDEMGFALSYVLTKLKGKATAKISNTWTK